MKKVLILAYDFPPYVSVGGLRPFSWFSYLREFGVFPTVITRQWNNKHGNHLDYIAPSDSAETVVESSEKGIILKTPYEPNLSNRLFLKYGDSRYKLSRKFVSLFYELSQYLFVIGPKSNLYFEAEKYLSENKTDVIIATGEPYVLFYYASRLSKKFNIPWIADYRDPWTQDGKRRDVGIPEIWDAFQEKKTLSTASAVVTVSEFFQKKIESLVKNKPFYIVPNGYDPEAVEKVKSIKQSTEKLSIGLAGTIYKWYPLESFLRVCSDFASRYAGELKFEINFYGINNEDEVRLLIETKHQNLKPIVKIHQKVANEALLEKLALNNVFLLFNNYSYMGTKIYDYLGLKRRIILCYGNDPEARELKKKYFNMEDDDEQAEQLQQKVLTETRSGMLIEDANHLRAVLEDLYTEFRANGFIACDSVNTAQYSRKIQAGNLAGIVEKTLANQKEIDS